MLVEEITRDLGALRQEPRAETKYIFLIMSHTLILFNEVQGQTKLTYRNRNQNRDCVRGRQGRGTENFLRGMEIGVWVHGYIHLSKFIELSA